MYSHMKYHNDGRNQLSGAATSPSSQLYHATDAATLNTAIYSALTLQSNEFHYPPSHTSVWIEQGTETMARVTKTAYGTGHSLLPKFFKFLLPNLGLYIVNNMFIYAHI